MRSPSAQTSFRTSPASGTAAARSRSAGPDRTMNGAFGIIEGNWNAPTTGSSWSSWPPRVARKIGPPGEAMPGETRTGSGSEDGTIPPITSEAPDSIS